MKQPLASEGRAAALREAFDRSFALPPAQASDEVEDLLAIRIQGDAYAIRLSDIAGVVTGRKVVSLPSATPDFLGLAGIRGGIVPVFGLSSILGHGQGAESPRWMMLCGVDEPMALGFSDFDGYLRIPRSDVHADEELHGVRRYVRELFRTEIRVRGIVNIPLIVATLRHRRGDGRSVKEQ